MMWANKTKFITQVIHHVLKISSDGKQNPNEQKALICELTLL